MTDENYYHSIYDPTTQSLITVPFTEEEIRVKKEQEAKDEEFNLKLGYSKLRKERDERLLRSDWTQLPNAKLSEEDKILWENYREQLRNLPIVVLDPYNFEWPVSPQDSKISLVEPGNEGKLSL